MSSRARLPSRGTSAKRFRWRNGGDPSRNRAFENRNFNKVRHYLASFGQFASKLTPWWWVCFCDLAFEVVPIEVVRAALRTRLDDVSQWLCSGAFCSLPPPRFPAEEVGW